MFRTMRRIRQQLSDEEVRRLLHQGKRGVLAVLGDDEYPYAVPMNYDYDEAHNRILFHGAKEGHKIDAVRRHPKVSFCVHDEGVQNEGEWFYHVKSAIVFGRIEEIQDQAEAFAAARSLSLKYNPDEAYADEEIRLAGSRLLCLALNIEHMTGKSVTEK